jgi:hypothetical protein
LPAWKSPNILESLRNTPVLGVDGLVHPVFMLGM